METDSSKTSKKNLMNSMFSSHRANAYSMIEYEGKTALLRPEDLEHIDAMNSAGPIKKLFMPMATGGIRSSVFTFFSCTVGAGILSLPAIFQYFGLVLGTLFLLLSAWISRLSYMILAEALKKSRKKTFPNCVAHFLGKVFF